MFSGPDQKEREFTGSGINSTSAGPSAMMSSSRFSYVCAPKQAMAFFSHSRRLRVKHRQVTSGLLMEVIASRAELELRRVGDSFRAKDKCRGPYTLSRHHTSRPHIQSP